MTPHSPITDSDLQAYVDEQLEPERRQQVESWLRDNPQAATQVREYQQLNDSLHQHYDPILEQPLPAQLSMQGGHRHAMLRIAAITAWMVIGGVLGWTLHPVAYAPMANHDLLSTDLVRPAAFAHRIYSVEVKHPVEVSAREEKHLVKWLSKRLHTNIKIPDLSAHGFTLVGGRLLPSTDRMAAQFMYQRADGTRITLYKRHGNWKDSATSFHFSEQNNVGVFYWIDETLAYALVGELQRKELLTLAEEIHRQLD